jgi:hypothetical protein
MAVDQRGCASARSDRDRYSESDQAGHIVDASDRQLWEAGLGALALARPITPTPEPASLVDQVASLKAALAKAEAEIAALKTALESEQGRLAEVQAERDRLLNRSWWRRLVG